MHTSGFISDWNKVFPRSCLLCSSGFFWLGFIQEFHHSVARVPALRDCSCEIDAKANENIGLDLKPATILQNASLWNTQTCEFVATWAPKHHKYDPVYFRFFVTATENGTFSTINISKTIAGATGGDRSYWKSNKQATRKCKNWTQKAKKKETKHLFRNITPNTRETNAVRWSLKTQKKNQHLGQTHL